MSEKTEQPTEKKIKDGREEGQVVKSVEITSGVQLLAIFLFFHFLYDSIIEQLKDVIKQSIDLINKPFSYALSALVSVLWQQFSFILGLLGAAVIIATVSAVVIQTGIVIATKAVGFKGERINPVNNMKQIFSLHSIIELTKSTLKVSILCMIFMYISYFYLPTLRALPGCDLQCALPVFSALAWWIWVGMMIFYVLLGVFDYAFQHYHIMKQLRMSKDEVKREYKDTEGDPEVKRHRRELHHEIQSGSLAQKVSRSTAIVRNPTHIAVCLGYDPVEMPIPQVLEKGADEWALHIVNLAYNKDIPVVENRLLARSLFNDVGRGETIPESLFEPVAALLRIVLKIDYDAGSSPENEE